MASKRTQEDKLLNYQQLPGKSKLNAELSGEDYSYAYPLDLDLKPGTEMHNRLVSWILERANSSASLIQNRIPSWNEIEKTLTTYISLDDDELDILEADDRKPVSIVIPISWAVLETLVTYLSGMFLDDPIFPYSGVGPEDEVGAILLERLVDRDAREDQMDLALMQMFRDSLAYGIGCVVPSWKVEYGERGRIRLSTEQMFNMLKTGQGTNSDLPRSNGIIYEGNELTNIDPCRLLPPAATPIKDYQKAEYLGWVESTNAMQILRRELNDGSGWFNGKYVLDYGTSYSYFTSVSSRSSARDRDQTMNFPGDSVHHNVDEVNLLVDLIPSEWGLGERDNPEKWHFAVAGDQFLTRAEPIALRHGKYPVVFAAPTFDYSNLPLSVLEQIYGLQKQANWCSNARTINVRKSLNDMIVYDPSVIRSDDVSDPKAGKLIRTRRSVWGRPIGDSIHQLRVDDVTKQYMVDLQIYMELIQQISGATGLIQGIGPRSGDRVTAKEIGITQSGALGRLDKTARILYSMTMRPLAKMLASNTQQFMTQTQRVRILGPAKELLENLISQEMPENLYANPELIDVNFDVQLDQPIVPRAQDADLMVKMLDIASRSEIISDRLDVIRLFRQAFRQAGARNVHEFILPAQQIQQGVESGQLQRMEAPSVQ